MPQPPPERVYFGDERWRTENRFTWFPGGKFVGRALHHQDGRTTTLEKMICERVSVAPDEYESVGRASAVHQAVTAGRNSDVVATIVKVWMR